MRQGFAEFVADGAFRVIDLDGLVPTGSRHTRTEGMGVPSRRAAVIHRLVPSAAALRPSRVVANFQVTKGRRLSIAKVQARFTVLA